MSQEIWVALYAVVYALTLFISKGINLRNIIKNGNVLKSEFKIDIDKTTEENSKLWIELASVKSVNTFLIKELLANYQARLEITNDEDEIQKLLSKIQSLTELLK